MEYIEEKIDIDMIQDEIVDTITRNKKNGYLKENYFSMPQTSGKFNT